MVKCTSILHLDNLVILYLKTKKYKRIFQTQDWLHTHQLKDRERIFVPKQNKLAVLEVAEYVERALIAVIGLGVNYIPAAPVFLNV